MLLKKDSKLNEHTQSQNHSQPLENDAAPPCQITSQNSPCAISMLWTHVRIPIQGYNDLRCMCDVVFGMTVTGKSIAHILQLAAAAQKVLSKEVPTKKTSIESER